MSLIEDFKGKESGRIGEGTYPARISQIIDLGTQEVEWKGETKQQLKIWITFELPTERITTEDGDKPRWLSSEFTKSTNERSRLLKVIQAANPDAESFSDLLNCELLVEVGTTSGGKDKWVGSTALPKGMSVSPLENKVRYFDLENPDEEIFEELPEFLKEKIESSPEYSNAPF